MASSRDRAPDSSWTHNTAYHPWVTRVAARLHGDELDVGCGDGLLLQRLSPHSHSLTGVEPHAPSACRAPERLAGISNATVHTIGFDAFAAEPASFDLITFVASLHHMPLEPALRKTVALLRPGGELSIVGLSRRDGMRDLVLDAARIVPARIGHRPIRLRSRIAAIVAAHRMTTPAVTGTAAAARSDTKQLRGAG